MSEQTEKPKHYVLQIDNVTLRAQAALTPKPPVKVEKQDNQTEPKPENKA